MKAISLWQPWASLIAVGGKRIETRHWAAPRALWGQRIAIHAAKRQTELWLCDEHPFTEYDLIAESLPLGALVATAVLDRCTVMNELGIADLAATRPHEHAFGHYEIGRYAWVLRDVEQLVAPIPWRGSQRFFDIPDDLVGHRPPQEALL